MKTKGNSKLIRNDRINTTYKDVLNIIAIY